MKDYKELERLKLVPLKCEDIVSELREETAYPPYVDMLMKRAAEAVEQLVKEHDNARRTLDQTLVRLNDETVRAERLEAENRAKEQYIAETIGKLARERKRDDEIIASLQRELVETAKERDQWMTLGHLANKRAEDYRGMRRQRDEAIKERDNARRTLDQTLVRLNDETVRAERLEAENRAKEQYIAETIGKVIKERAESPCDLCRFNPPSCLDGKPCTICPAVRRQSE